MEYLLSDILFGLVMAMVTAGTLFALIAAVVYAVNATLATVSWLYHHLLGR